MESIATKNQSSVKTVLKQLLIWVLSGLVCIFLANCSLFQAETGTVQLVLQGIPSDLSQNASIQPGSSLSTRAMSPIDPSFLSMSLTISGPSMSTQQYYYKSIPNSISISVPAGRARHFALDINVNPKLPSAVLTFSGEQTVDLNPGENKAVDFAMAVSETKIVFPDYFQDFSNNGTTYPRLVQMDNIKGDGWIERNANNLIGFQPSYPDSFKPRDVDFDAIGRIYVPASVSYSSYPKIVRLDNMAGFAATTIIDRYSTTPSANNDGIQAEIQTIAIDRKNNYLYYAYLTQIRKYNLQTGVISTIPNPTVPAPVNEFYKLAVDKDGLLYISCEMGAVAPLKYLIKYDPVTMSTLKTFNRTNFLAGDVLFRDDYILVANYSSYSSAGNMILKLDTNLNFIKGYGYPVADWNVNEPRKGFFYRPARFVGLSRKKIRLIDDGSLSVPSEPNPTDPFINRIITMDNIEDWSGWDFLYKTGTDHFMFFVC